MSLLQQRRNEVATRLDGFRQNVSDAIALCHAKACVYLTGSFARGEATAHSDLDLFIVGRASDGKRALSRLDEICVKADLIDTTRKLNLPEFSGDGAYLTYYNAGSFIENLGQPEDDSSNTFTARMLLLLESRPLIGESVHRETIESVIAKYWRDFTDHKHEFVPAFLANDILRLWRTFCVNYEARTATEPEAKKAKRKLKNYKLKHSRLLTCFSALAYLLKEFAEQGTVTPSATIAMAALTPTERIESLAGVSHLTASATALLDSYQQFLQNTDKPESELVAMFMQRDQSRAYFDDASAFGQKMFDLLASIGQASSDQRFWRLLTV